jgi:ribosome-binding factor A
MKRHNPRALKIGDQIQRELFELIRDELKDPRVRKVTITGVEVSADYGHAKVFFTALADAEQRKEILAGLERAAGFLRSGLSQRLKLYSVPQLHFVYDDSIESGMRLSSLIDEAVAQDRKLGKGDA